MIKFRWLVFLSRKTSVGGRCSIVQVGTAYFYQQPYAPLNAISGSWLLLRCFFHGFIVVVRLEQNQKLYELMFVDFYWGVYINSPPGYRVSRRLRWNGWLIRRYWIYFANSQKANKIFLESETKSTFTVEDAKPVKHLFNCHISWMCSLRLAWLPWDGQIDADRETCVLRAGGRHPSRSRLNMRMAMLPQVIEWM